MTYVALAFLAVMPMLVIIAGLTDLTSMKIPNWISGLLILFFFPAAFLAGLSVSNILLHLGVAFAALIVGMAMFALRWLGGGDAKLVAATCLWMGLAGTGPFVIWTALAGGLFGLGLLIVRRHVAPRIATSGWVAALVKPDGDIPYGVAIAVGALLAYPSSPLVAGLTGG